VVRFGGMACSCTTELAVHLVGRLNISTESPISRCSESALRLLVENEGAKRPFCGGPLSIEPMINRIVAGAILATWSTIKARAIWSDRRLWVSYQRLWLKLPSADRGDDGYLALPEWRPAAVASPVYGRDREAVKTFLGRANGKVIEGV
jgi:hypothetical protein